MNPLTNNPELAEVAPVERPKLSTYFIAVYDVDQRYGGPEEGGWYYNRGSLVRIVKVMRAMESDNAMSSNNWDTFAPYVYCRRLNAKLASRAFGPNQGKREFTSVLSHGELCAEVYENEIPPDHYPKVRPHYE